MKPYLLGWLSGLLTGLILVERWHRKGALHFLEPDDVEQAVELGAPTDARRPSPKEPPVTTMIVTAAKADAERARELLGRAVPWGIAPSFGSRTRRGGHTPGPGSSPSP